MTRRRVLIVAIVLAIIVALGLWQLASPPVPEGQRPLVTLDAASLTTLREDFNQAAEGARIIVLLSPT